MHRRLFLASLATGVAGLAGCSFTSDSADMSRDPNGSADGTAPNGTRTRPPAESERPERHASIVELDTAALTYAFVPVSFRTDDEAEVTLWFDRTATADHPARLIGWIANENGFENTFRVEWIPAVGGVHSRTPSGDSHEARLHLAPTENNALAETVPSLTRTDGGFWTVEDVGPWMVDTYRMEPGERRRLEFVVVGESGVPERPLGTYEFRGDDSTATITVWETDSPGPERESRFAGRSVPDLDGARSVRWYHDADRTTPAFLEPESEELALDGAVGFEMVNNSHETLRCGHWDLYKLVDDEWYHVAPQGHLSDCRGLFPGRRLSWTLRAFNGEAVHCGCEEFGRDGLTRGYLGGGTYAVVVGYGHEADTSGALLAVTGDPVTIVPTGNVTTERDGDTVTVTTGSYGDGEHPPDASFTLTRVDSASERVLPEQVMASGNFGSPGNGLRNALAAMTADIHRVIVRADKHAVDQALGNEKRTRRLELRGQAYELSRRSENE